MFGQCMKCLDDDLHDKEAEEREAALCKDADTDGAQISPAGEVLNPGATAYHDVGLLQTTAPFPNLSRGDDT